MGGNGLREYYVVHEWGRLGVRCGRFTGADVIAGPIANYVEALAECSDIAARRAAEAKAARRYVLDGRTIMRDRSGKPTGLTWAEAVAARAKLLSPAESRRLAKIEAARKAGVKIPASWGV